MSRRARRTQLAREMKRATAYQGPEDHDDEDDDEGSHPDAYPDHLWPDDERQAEPQGTTR